MESITKEQTAVFQLVKKKMKSKEKTDIDEFLNELIHTQIILESKMNQKVRKNNGVYFTNELEILKNINSILPFDERIFSMKILEPSCGHGIFLLYIISRAYKINPNKNIILNFIKDNLIFVDICPEMIEITKQNINKIFQYFYHDEYKGKFNGFSYDFTEKLTSCLLNKYDKHPLFNYLGEIDCVVGNPPYVSLYGRRDKKQNEQQRINYLKNYNQFPSSVKNGKINLVMLFIEHGLDFLKKSGFISFIIDISFFETAYQHTRKYLLENTKIISIEHNLSNFSGVASGQIILKLEKNNSNVNHCAIVKNFSDGKSVTINQSEWNNKNDGYKFRIDKCELTEKIIEKIYEKKEKTLKNLFPNKNL